MDPPSSPSSGLPGSFGYQTRLLERTASTRGSASLSRANTIKSNGLNMAPTISYTRAHRVGSSLDAVRGKWEERARAAEALDSPVHSRSASPTKDDSHRFGVSNEVPTPTRTPTYLKRQTMPSPIIASPLSPNSTGISVEDSSSSRIHLPVSFPVAATPPIEKAYAALDASSRFTPSPPTRWRRSNTVDTAVTRDSTGSSTGSDPSSPRTSTRPSFLSSSSQRRPVSTYGVPAPSTEPSSPTRPSARTRPLSLYGASRPDLSSGSSASLDRPSPVTAQGTNDLKHNFTSTKRSVDIQPSASNKAPSSRQDITNSIPSSDRQQSAESTSSVMSPAPYRSSYMAKKYGDTLTSGRRLGRHLPRIASGDGEDHKQEDRPEEPKQSPSSPASTGQRQRVEIPTEVKARPRIATPHTLRETTRPSPSTPTPRSFREENPSKLLAESLPVTSEGDVVVGVPGRIPLTRSRTAKLPPSPLPSAKLAGRNAVTPRFWADKERHLLQAHEYLCHVGEAQQWIEGCLDEELGFGIVEMEDGLQNGVVLARLARIFQGEAVVKRIYQAPKLDYRHSDNINIFFNFVRDAGLPECFIFELTDLYNKKNLPKVIYCIHALSHLLARRGLAQRIGNLLGRLEFSDDQLQKTQKGLRDAGVPMPNFGNVGRELAKEINEEPEPEEEEETEDERRDRLLMECEDSILALQSLTRGFLVRKAHATTKVRLNLIERHVPAVQAQCRGALLRRRVGALRKQQDSLVPWAIKLQATCRGNRTRQLWLAKLRRIHSISPFVIGVQAQIRGLIVRRRFLRLKAALKKCQPAAIKLQTALRAQLVKNKRHAAIAVFTHPSVQGPVISFQALARGALKRRQIAKQQRRIQSRARIFVALQAQCRGVLTRRRMRSQLARLEDVSQTIVRIQAAARTFLARRRLLKLIRALRKATPMLVGLQAKARANLARQRHDNLSKALSRVQVIKSVNTFQARARAALARNRHREQARELEFVEPDVVGIQACCRGVLARWEYYGWKEHLHRHYPVATILQAMLRGALVRREFFRKLQYYHDNLQKVIKIQSLFRAKETREQYRQLTMGSNVSADTIKNFVHLLDDSEADFQEEIKVERLRKLVVEGIRENQALESEVSDLDVKISLIVQNTKSFEELMKSRRRHRTDNNNSLSLLAAHGDPFAGPSTLDHAAKRKRDLYQQLFYLLQTRGEYLSRLFTHISLDSGQSQEKNRRLTERVVLTLFGYGQDKREDYLLLKLFQHAIHEEVARASSIEDVIRSHPMFINVAVQYIRPRQLVYVREAFQTIIRAVLQEENLSLEVDPSAIHRMRIDLEELQTGVPSNEPKDIKFREALEIPQTRVQYIHHLQTLQAWAEAFVTAILESTRKMPYSMRYLARETLLSVQEKFPDAPIESQAACIAKLVYYRYINPAIVTPETFDIVSSTVDIKSRKNLAQISRVLTQITSGQEFGDDNPSFLPINEFVNKTIGDITHWMLEVADVQDAEAQLQAHEFLDATLQPKPIYITPNEIYGMHTLLSQYLPQLAPSSNDTLKVILSELNGVPHFGNDELKDARDTAITLDLTNRFAEVKDPLADEKALWVQAKRGVLAILRVQPAKTLWDSLTAQVVDEHEVLWQEVLENEDEQQRHMSRRMPSSTGADSAYRLEDIRSLSFKEVKLHTIHFLVELEKKGKVTRADGFQEILNAIAGDVRSKHRKRIRRQQEMDSMKEALKHLAERKKFFEEKLESYNSYIETSIASMQKKGKKGFVIPFTKQYFHDRDLKRSGRVPQYGSYINSAKDLYEKRILLSIDQYSPRQFDKMNFTISSNTPGVFTVLLESTALGSATRIASEDVKMEDLLQAKFEDRASLSLYKNTVKMNLELFIAHINKKFYV